jgi:sterol desaturase/sphingolipid hydroxylase (fatty acid hydroxylase superfamily)
MLEHIVEKAMYWLVTPGSRLNLVGWASVPVLGYIAWRLYKPAAKNFWAWIFPREMYTHPSHITDIKLLFTNYGLSAIGITSFVGVSTFVTAYVYGGLELMMGTDNPKLEWDWGRLVVLAVAFALISDFCTYWVHRLHHLTPWLWPFHKVHHSAEVMTPITFYRKHPIYDIISRLVKGVVLGSISAILLFLFVGDLSTWQIGGINASVALFNVIGGNLRHSHIWFHWGKLGYVLCSPAMHQIHHSRDAMKHWNKNFAEMFSLWDWIFGTLYLPKEKEDIQFGLPNARAILLPQPHPTLREAIMRPFRESAAAFKKSFGIAPRKAQPTVTPPTAAE